jgi:transmembrane protein EpsG
MASALLVIQNQGFMRIQQYFSVFIMLTVPELINVIKREYRVLGYLAFGAVMIFYLIQNDPAYRFFFM